MDNDQGSSLPLLKRSKINFSFSGTIEHLKVCNNNLFNIVVSKIPASSSVVYSIKRYDLESNSPTDAVEAEIGRISAGSSAYDIENPVRGLFVDPTGRHAIISTHPTFSDALYLQRGSKKPRPLSKAKNFVITSVAWNRSQTTDSTTGPILVGTESGQIFETELGGSEQWKQVWSTSTPAEPITGLEIAEVPVRSVLPASAAGNQLFYMVLFATPTRLYQVLACVAGMPQERSLFQHVFECAAPQTDAFISMPPLSPTPGDAADRSAGGGAAVGGALQLFYPEYRSLPAHAAWFSGAGVFWGSIDLAGPVSAALSQPAAQLRAPTKLFTQNLIEYAALRPDLLAGQTAVLPVSLALTQFHAIVLFSDLMLRAVNLLSGQVVFEDALPRTAQLSAFSTPNAALWWDGIGKRVLWSYTDTSVFKYTVHNEARDMWQIHLQRKEYESAREYCKNDAVKTELVFYKQASELYQNGDYEKSAELFSQLKTHSFEEIALKFLQLPEKRPLRLLLSRKMELLLGAEESGARGDGAQKASEARRRVQAPEKLSASDRTQLLVWLVWLLELFLNEMALLRDRSAAPPPPAAGVVASAATLGESAKYKQVEAEFRQFLASPPILAILREKSVAENIYSMMNSHGDRENLVFLASLLGDYEREVDYYMQNANYAQALKILEKQILTAETSSRERVMAQLYARGAQLMSNVPELLVDCLIRLHKAQVRVDADRFLHAASYAQSVALASGSPANAELKESRYTKEALRYLELIMRDSKDTGSRALHNYLVALYCKPTLRSEQKLLNHFRDSASFSGAGARGSETIGDLLADLQLDDAAADAAAADAPGVDVQFALRVCLEAGLSRAAVQLYMQLNLYDEAVETALSVDLELAKKCARAASSAQMDDESVSKRLWLKIARWLANSRDGEEERTLGVALAMNVLRECPALRIEDLVNIFPDFTTIDHLKDALSTSLGEYDRHIESLKEEMRQVQQSTETLRSDTRLLKNMHLSVRSDCRCELCRKYVFSESNISEGSSSGQRASRGFFIYPCEHAFHVSCLYYVALENLYDAIRSTFQVAANRAKLRAPGGSSARAATSSASEPFVNLLHAAQRINTSNAGDVFEELVGLTEGARAASDSSAAALEVKALMDQLVSSECPLCGTLAIEMVDAPLVDLQNYDLLKQSWN